MKKIFLLSCVSVSLLLAIQGVSHGDVVVSINNKIVHLKNGETISLKIGDKICYIKGDGSLIVKEKDIVIDDMLMGFCPVIKPPKKNRIDAKQVVSLLLNTDEMLVNGVSVRTSALNIGLKNKSRLKITLEKSMTPAILKIYERNKMHKMILINSANTIKLSNYKNIQKMELYINNKLYLIIY